jgi:hypothetical protein
MIRARAHAKKEQCCLVRSESDANLSCPQDVLKGTILQLLALSLRDSAVVLSNDLVGLQHALSKVFQPTENIVR